MTRRWSMRKYVTGHDGFSYQVQAGDMVFVVVL